MYCSILQKQVQIHNSSTVSRIDYKVTTSFITKKKHLCFIGWNVNPNVDIYNLELIVSNKSMLLKELVIFTLYKAIRNLINYSLMPFLKSREFPLLRAAVVHLNFRAGSAFSVPVCAVSPGHWVNKQMVNRTSRCNKVDAVRLKV